MNLRQKRLRRRRLAIARGMEKVYFNLEWMCQKIV
jgi:hypothetical protein